jgi:transmembrane sensor
VSDRDTEAATWFARMRASDADTARAEFEAWHADPENAEAYAAAEEDWLITGGVADEHFAAHRQVSSGSTTPSRAHWALAAALVIAISLAFAWMQLGNGGTDPVVADNSTGEVVLEDGTRVALMDGARVEARFTSGERRVHLVGGRARFTVAHDSARPFRVEAAGSETTALGTIFEIDLTGRRPVVHLVEGSVEVRATAKRHAPLRLRPGQRAAVENDAPILIESKPGGETAAVDDPASGSDRPELLLAEGLPLGAVIDRANRVSSVKIGLADPTIGGRLVSGRFDVSDARSLARQLAAALDLHVQEQPGRYVLLPKIVH